MKPSEIRDNFNALRMTTGSDLPEMTAADQLFWEKTRQLKAATNAIRDLQIGAKSSKETALAEIQTTNERTISDLPEIVATAIAQPWGSLGIDNSPQWGATESPWYIFQHASEDFMRGKISRAMMRKMQPTAERLELAIGCIQWAGTVGVHDIPQFQAAFTSALILDNDATTELNGETIEIRPEDTKIPLDKSVLMQILNGVKSLIAGQDEIKSKFGEPPKDGLNTTSRKYPQDAEALALLDAAAKLKTKLAKKDQKITNEAVIQALLDEPDGRETKKQKDQRLKYQYRVWYGAVKNGTRKNKTATPPKNLDPKRRAVTWKKFYKDWGKHLSCYIKHPSAK